MKKTLPPQGSPRPSAPRVLIVGERRDRRRLLRSLHRSPWAGLPVVGFVDAGHTRYRLAGGSTRRPHLAVHPGADPVPVLGGVDRLDEWVGRSRATHVVMAVPGGSAHWLRPRIDCLGRGDVAVHWLDDDGDEVASPPGATDPPQVLAPRSSPLPASRLVKRALDFCGAAAGLTLLSPLFAAVAAAIWVSSGRPIFYHQERVGRGGRLFKMVKFRSMRRDAEGQTGPVWATSEDTRCTRIGNWLRNTTIDELPQLYNVLKGEMSLVGPRPERPVFVAEFRAALPDYDLRHAVPGGMTGWAQVHGWRGRTSLRKRVQYDLDYIHRWSVGLDLRILFMTVQHVLFGRTHWAPKKPEAGR